MHESSQGNAGSRWQTEASDEEYPEEVILIGTTTAASLNSVFGADRPILYSFGTNIIRWNVVFAGDVTKLKGTHLDPTTVGSLQDFGALMVELANKSAVQLRQSA